MKQFRIIRIASLSYKNAAEHLLAKHPHFKNLSFEKQQELLFNEFYGYGNSISWYLGKLGHETKELVYDFELMQKTWAKEKGISYKEKWQESILLSQIKHYKPEVLYFQDIHSLAPEIILNIKEIFPFIKLLIVFRGFPKWHPTLGQILGKADLAFVGSPHLISQCEKMGIKAHLMYHFFDERILSSVDKIKPTIDFSFIGSSGFGYGFDHAPRYWMLHQLLEKTNLQLWIDEKQNPLHFKNFIKNLLLKSLSQFPVEILEKNKKIPHFFGKFFIDAIEIKKEYQGISKPLKPLKKIHPKSCQNGLFGLEMYRKLAESKISFNKHSGPALGAVDNIRLFQATGMGSCLLTDTGKNMEDLFESDHELVTYNHLDECLEKIAYLSEHENECLKIGLNGQKRTLRDHTASKRCLQMNELIQEKG